MKMNDILEGERSVINGNNEGIKVHMGRKLQLSSIC